VILGVVYEANLKECFYTWEGAPSFLNGKEVRVSKADELSQCLIATGFPNRDYSRMEEYMALLNDLMFSCHGIRRIGSAAVDLAYVACGRFEAFYEYYLSPWDVAAGSLLVQNAGGHVSDFSGGTNYLFGQEIIASNTRIHQALNDKLQHFFNHGKA
jgi:myo-inositol-1(or 4)-monophosphatase